MVVGAPLASKGKCRRCYQNDAASHNCNRYWIVGGYSKHETSHGPGTMNGLKLAAAAKARRPEMNIIIVTGYTAPKNDEIPPGSLFVPKPYNARKMIEAVRHFQ